MIRTMFLVIVNSQKQLKTKGRLTFLLITEKSAFRQLTVFLGLVSYFGINKLVEIGLGAKYASLASKDIPYLEANRRRDHLKKAY